MSRFARLIGVMLAVMLVTTISVAAQVGYGVKGGLNFANFSGADSDGYQREAGFVGGLYAKFDIGRKLSIQPEVLYSQKGSTGNIPTGDGLGGITKLDIEMDYIEIPLILRYTIPTTGSVEPFAYVGASISFITRAEVASKAPGQSWTTIDIANEKSSDLGFVFGGGVELDAGSMDVLFDARLSLGTSGLFEDLEHLDVDDALVPGADYRMARDDGEAFELKHSVFAVMVGIAF